MTIKEFTLADGREMSVELDFTPSSIMEYKDYLTCEKDGNLLVGYLDDDSDCMNPLEDCDGMGHIYTSHRHSKTQDDMQKALGLDSNWDPEMTLVEEEAIVASVHQKIIEQPELLSVATQYCRDYFVQSDDETSTTFMFRNLDSREALEEAGLTEQVEESEKALWIEGREKGTIGNKYAVSLDVYEHGGVSYSVSGSGMQCQFDTAKGGAVWVPDDTCVAEITRRAAVYCKGKITEQALKSKTQCGVRTYREFGYFDETVHPVFECWHDAFLYLEALPTPAYCQPLGEAENDAAKEMARAACTEYTSWCNGDCYGHVIETFEIDDNAIEKGHIIRNTDQDACGGYIGSDYAYRALQDAFKENNDEPSV